MVFHICRAGSSRGCATRVQRVRRLIIAAGKSSARPVQWREGSRPGSGRSGFKRMYSRFVALADPARRT